MCHDNVSVGCTTLLVGKALSNFDSFNERCTLCLFCINLNLLEDLPLADHH